MPERIDHLQRMRLEPEPDGAPDKDAPTVTPALIEYLEKTFQHPYPQGAGVGSVDGAVEVANVLASYAGAKAVIAHLKTLLRTA